MTYHNARRVFAKYTVAVRIDFYLADALHASAFKAKIELADS